VVLVVMTGFTQEGKDRPRSREAGFHPHPVKLLDLAGLKRLLARPGVL
jgi:hypothetical protein